MDVDLYIISFFEHILYYIKDIELQKTHSNNLPSNHLNRIPLAVFLMDDDDDITYLEWKWFEEQKPSITTHIPDGKIMQKSLELKVLLSTTYSAFLLFVDPLDLSFCFALHF